MTRPIRQCESISQLGHRRPHDQDANLHLDPTFDHRRAQTAPAWRRAGTATAEFSVGGLGVRAQAVARRQAAAARGHSAGSCASPAWSQARASQRIARRITSARETISSCAILSMRSTSCSGHAKWTFFALTRILHRFGPASERGWATDLGDCCLPTLWAREAKNRHAPVRFFSASSGGIPHRSWWFGCARERAVTTSFSH